jgi:hypothetical protein
MAEMGEQAFTVAATETPGSETGEFPVVLVIFAFTPGRGLMIEPGPSV